jgi:aryl-alcohol dehydrogenase-like predicted oxidoreductase
VLSSVAARLDASPLTVALAWLLQRSPNLLLIPGTSSVAHLHENLSASGLAIAPDLLKELNNLA